MRVAWRHKDDTESKPPLHYTECGLDDVYLLSGYTRVKTPYGTGISVKDADELHKAIGCNLATEKKVLNAKELRFLRKHMELTQSDLGRFLGLSSQQVARWEKGVSEISGPADLLVRALFLEHIGGKLNLQELANALEEPDSPMVERACFERTQGEWRLRKAA
jgi:DNA-binding transcriptional regulator YiaG